jgi:hypothetical protein
MNGVEAAPILLETLSRTKIQSLVIRFRSPVSLLNGGRRVATALERCTCITDLLLALPSYNNEVEMEFFQILVVESIPKMLGLKKFDLQIKGHVDQLFFDMMGQCIGGHQGEIEELKLVFHSTSVNSSSILGLAPALRRLKVIKFGGFTALPLQEISELSGIAADCETLDEFGHKNFSPCGASTENFNAICQLCSKFPCLKRVTQGCCAVDLREDGRFVAFLEMIKTSKTIEQVPQLKCRNAEERAAIEYHCRNNMMHNQIRENGLLAATVPSSAWPLILNEFSDMPDVLYYLLQQKHVALV